MLIVFLKVGFCCLLARAMLGVPCILEHRSVEWYIDGLNDKSHLQLYCHMTKQDFLTAEAAVRWQFWSHDFLVAWSKVGRERCRCCNELDAWTDTHSGSCFSIYIFPAPPVFWSKSTVINKIILTLIKNSCTKKTNKTLVDKWKWGVENSPLKSLWIACFLCPLLWCVTGLLLSHVFHFAHYVCQHCHR